MRPVSGEIEAQPLNDNFSFLESQIKSINGGPKETFSSLTALQSKYPNGNSSAMLVLESDGKTGYLYGWSGSAWVKGALYQSQGLAEGAVKDQIVADDGIIGGKLAKDAVQKNNVAPVAIKATNTDFLKFDGIDVFDPSLNESGAIYPATGLDWAVSGYTRSGYLPVAGAKFLKIVDPTVTLNDSHAFFYDAQKQFLSHVDLRGNNGDIYLFNDGVRRIFVLPVPENVTFYRMWLKSTAYDLTTNCQIRIYSEFGSQNATDNSTTFAKTVDSGFLKNDDVEISVNLYDPKKSEVGGLNPDGSSKSANIEGAQGYSRSGFIALNGGENADGMMFEWSREGLTSTNLDFTFIYQSGIDLSICATVASIGGTVENGVMRFTIPKGSDYRYLRIIDKNPSINEEVAAAQTVKKVTEKDDVSIKGKSLSDIFRRKDDPIGQNNFLPRPENGVVNFTVPINTSMLYQKTEDTLSIQDDESWDVDDAILFLPINYDPDGEAVPFVVNCHGAGTTITNSTTVLSQPVPNLINLGYAVLDVNGVPKALSNNSGLHYGSPLALQSYLKAYDYVIKRYNVKKDVFVVGTSMGGLSSNMIVQSGSIPVISQASLCGVTDHFKQAYCNPWNAPATQRSQIAKLFGFTGTEPTWTSSKYPSQAEIDYYMANLDKVIGCNPMLKNTINWQTVDPYSYPNQTVEEQTAEAAEYQKMIKIHQVPLKIWHNDNDTTVSPRYSEFYVNAIRNAGGLAYLRKFPSGAHNAWDNGETITIKNISGADMIVTATTYELNLWFKRFLGGG